MAKVFGLKTSMLKPKKRISVRMPAEMLKEIDETLDQLNISPRLRSRWISHAIVNFYQQDDYIAAVQEEWITPGRNTIVQIQLEESAEHAMHKMAHALHTSLANSSDYHSSIVRAGIIHEFLRNDKGKTMQNN